MWKMIPTPRFKCMPSIKVMKQTFFLCYLQPWHSSLYLSVFLLSGGGGSINHRPMRDDSRAHDDVFNLPIVQKKLVRTTLPLAPLRVACVSRYTQDGDEAVYLSSAAVQVHSGIRITSSLWHHSVPLSPLCLTLPPNWHLRIWLGFTGWAVVAHTHKYTKTRSQSSQ